MSCCQILWKKSFINFEATRTTKDILKQYEEYWGFSLPTLPLHQVFKVLLLKDNISET